MTPARLRGPSTAMENLPGDCLSSAISSARVLAATPGCTTITWLLRVTRATGSKSFDRIVAQASSSGKDWRQARRTSQRRYVYPSGAARATALAPMTLPPPGLVLDDHALTQQLESVFASRRAMTSGLAPADCDTTKRSAVAANPGPGRRPPASRNAPAEQVSSFVAMTFTTLHCMRAARSRHDPDQRWHMRRRACQ